MPETIPLQDTVVYGPIHSRRLGHSLGINVLPVSRKVCSSNCVYCQYGWTPPPVSRPKAGQRSANDTWSASGGPRQVVGLKRAAALLTDIEEAFRTHAEAGTPVDCITLAGNGEPTLHPDLEELVVGIKRLRDQCFPKAGVGILTDATQITRPSVRRALGLLDVRYMKFDAADNDTWQRINLPLVKTSFHDMLAALRAMPDLVLQSMFIQGSFDNTKERHVRAWVEAVGSIKPLSVQVYTIDRGTAAEGIREVPRKTLQEIANRLTSATGIPAEVYD